MPSTLSPQSDIAYPGTLPYQLPFSLSDFLTFFYSMPFLSIPSTSLLLLCPSLYQISVVLLIACLLTTSVVPLATGLPLIQSNCDSISRIIFPQYKWDYTTKCCLMEGILVKQNQASLD